MQLLVAAGVADRGDQRAYRSLTDGSRVDTLDREAVRIRVLIVDDNDLFRVGLVSQLVADRGVEVVGQASRGQNGARLAGELRPDVVLMGLRMADLVGLDAIRTIVDRDPEARVVVLTVASTAADVVGAIIAGARGFLAKDTPIEGIVGAIRAASQGGAWLSPRAAEVILGRVRGAERSAAGADLNAAADLSARERGVLRLVACGMDNAEIAGVLQISPHTAKNHVANILRKLGVANRTQAATYAVRMAPG